MSTGFTRAGANFSGAQVDIGPMHNVTHDPVSRTGDSLAMRLLRAGIPLSLLLDLMDPTGPDSDLIARQERSPHDAPRDLAAGAATG